MQHKKYPVLYKALKKYYGYNEFRPGQYEIIYSLLAKRDVFGIMPTGAGKSVCYQIPAVFMPGITLVISPLISLMKDQVMQLAQSGIPAAYLNSSLTSMQYRSALTKAKEGAYKIIYVAPERLNTPGFLDFAMNTKISMIAIDEAHCISQWGQNFRPQYLEIPDFAAKLPERPVMAAFTATANGPVRDDIIRYLHLQNPFVLTTGFDRPNLYFEIQNVKRKDKNSALISFIQKHEGESGIIYCTTRKETEEVCDYLNRSGYPCTRYHAGLSEKERSQNQDDFLYDSIPLIAATCAFGMGINKSNVRFVVHYSLPPSLENYYQEAGRAGRDGEKAHCLLLFCRQDLATHRFLIEKSNEEGSKEQMLRELGQLRVMEQYCTTPLCLRSTMLQYFGETSSGHCQNCSNCTSAMIEEDVSDTAEKIYQLLSEFRYPLGLNTTLDALKGKESDQTKKHGLQRLEHFGVLSDMAENKIKRTVEGLMIQGYLERSMDMYQVVKMTPLLIKAVDEKTPVTLKHRPSRSELAQSVRKQSQKQSESASLFDALKALRLKMARIKKIPPYMIFSDVVIRNITNAIPCDMEELEAISGIGPAKAEKYGQMILDTIEKWQNAQKDAESEEE